MKAVSGANLGAVRQPRRRRQGCPMQAYDALPEPLRVWLSQAALPWSPASCRRIWRKARARGEGVEDVLARLDRAERHALLREGSGI
ncbi:MAG: hypothetical protein CML68_12650 [Rhodobacteraceae bacterium]|nr:hypothetical protein [Paracoccaceae bacterium]